MISMKKTEQHVIAWTSYNCRGKRCEVKGENSNTFYNIDMLIFQSGKSIAREQGKRSENVMYKNFRTLLTQKSTLRKSVTSFLLPSHTFNTHFERTVWQ